MDDQTEQHLMNSSQSEPQNKRSDLENNINEIDYHDGDNDSNGIVNEVDSRQAQHELVRKDEDNQNTKLSKTSIFRSRGNTSSVTATRTDDDIRSKVSDNDNTIEGKDSTNCAKGREREEDDLLHFRNFDDDRFLPRSAESSFENDGQYFPSDDVDVESGNKKPAAKKKADDMVVKDEWPYPVQGIQGSQYDYDMNWDMIGHRPDQDSINDCTANNDATDNDIEATTQQEVSIDKYHGEKGHNQKPLQEIDSHGQEVSMHGIVSPDTNDTFSNSPDLLILTNEEDITANRDGAAINDNEESSLNHDTKISASSDEQLKTKNNLNQEEEIQEKKLRNYNNMFLCAKSGDHEELERLLPPKVDFVPRRRTQSTPAAYRNNISGVTSSARKQIGHRISTDEEDASNSEDNNNFFAWYTEDDLDDDRTSYSASDIGSEMAMKKRNRNNSSSNSQSSNFWWRHDQFDNFTETPVGKTKLHAGIETTSINESVKTISSESQATTSSSSSNSSISRRRPFRFPKPGLIGSSTSSNFRSNFQFTNTASSSSPTELSISSNSLTHRRNQTQRSVPENHSILQQSTKPSRASVSSASLRSSLDVGMAAITRWVRSRTAATASAAHNGPRPSRAAIQLQRQNDGDNSSNTYLSPMQLGEEDFFALSMANDPRRGTPHFHHQNEREVYFNNSNIIYPPPIQEEDELPRQRSLSEPSSARLKSFFRSRHRRSEQADATTSLSSRNSSRSERRRYKRRLRALRGLGGTSSGADEELAVQTVSAGAASIISASDAASVRSLSSSAFRSASMHPSAPSTQDGTDVLENIRSIVVENNISTRSVSSASNTVRRSRNEEFASTNDILTNDNDDTRNVNPSTTTDDHERRARSRWVLINRRFQLIITFVALLFSLLLFSILVCWVILTSAYVVSIEKDCDVPLKQYYWLATIQLILDVFRTDIMKFVLRWDQNSRGRIPTRVIFYNLAYLAYAVGVLRLGVNSVFSEGNKCPETAPDLFQTSVVFVSLSISAWMTIILGYLGPFCFVAIILTRNGYSPSVDINGHETSSGIAGVFPSMYSSNGAPPDCIDRLRVLPLEDFSEEYPKECCICMTDFETGEAIVATECHHVFHKRCFKEWLRQSKTCPVCRTDIVESVYGNGESRNGTPFSTNNSRVTQGTGFPGGPFRREDFHHEVANLLRLLRRQEEQSRDRANTADTDSIVGTNTITVELSNMSNNNSAMRLNGPISSIAP